MASFNLGKIWPLLELLAKIRWVLACSCSQIFATACQMLERAKINTLLADARKHHSVPLIGVFWSGYLHTTTAMWSYKRFSYPFGILNFLPKLTIF